MKKLTYFIAALLLIPALSFASQLTDDQYREALTRQPITDTVNVGGMTAIVTLTFKKNSHFSEHLEAYTSLGHISMDMYGIWNVTNAKLNYRYTDGSYKRTSNSDLNDVLEKTKNKLIAEGEHTVNLAKSSAAAFAVANSFSAALHVK